jgi:hypothetical protein
MKVHGDEDDNEYGDDDSEYGDGSGTGGRHRPFPRPEVLRAGG